MPYEREHQEGIEQFQKGNYEQAVELISKALVEHENSERWNDWATAQAACGRLPEAEKGYLRALQLDSQHSQSALNLGLLLLAAGRRDEALPWLERSVAGLHGAERNAVLELLGDQGKQPGGAAAAPPRHKASRARGTRVLAAV